eukprot:1921770-Pyramimonas_sp.AAC.1
MHPRVRELPGQEPRRPPACVSSEEPACGAEAAGSSGASLWRSTPPCAARGGDGRKASVAASPPVRSPSEKAFLNCSAIAS